MLATISCSRVHARSGRASPRIISTRGDFIGPRLKPMLIEQNRDAQAPDDQPYGSPHRLRVAAQDRQQQAAGRRTEKNRPVDPDRNRRCPAEKRYPGNSLPGVHRLHVAGDQHGQGGRGDAPQRTARAASRGESFEPSLKRSASPIWDRASGFDTGPVRSAAAARRAQRLHSGRQLGVHLLEHLLRLQNAGRFIKLAAFVFDADVSPVSGVDDDLHHLCVVDLQRRHSVAFAKRRQCAIVEVVRLGAHRLRKWHQLFHTLVDVVPLFAGDFEVAEVGKRPAVRMIDAPHHVRKPPPV